MKRILCLCAALVLALTALVPVYANAAEEKMNVIYVSDKGNDNADGKSYSMAVKTLTRAIRLCYDGGTIVICGPLKISSSFQSPKTEGHITITSVHNGVDYMDAYNAKLQLGAKFILDGEYTLRDMKIETTEKNIVIVCMGKRVVFDEGIKTSAASSSVNLPSITCGDASNYQNGGARVTVNSGDWLRLRGGNRGTGGSKNGTYIEINGGSFSSTVECGGDSDAYGDAYMLINGGKFTGAIRVVGSTNLHGNAYIAIKGGSIKSFKLSDGGKINGKAEVYVTASGGTYTVSRAYATGGATAVRSAKQTVSGSCELVSDAAKAEAGAKLVEDAIKAEFAAIEKAREERINAWFDSFDVTKTGTASLGIAKENGGVELLSASVEAEGQKTSPITVIAIVLAVVAVIGAFVIWHRSGAKSAMSALLCPIMLAGTVGLFGCEKTPATTDTTDVTDTTSADATTAPAVDENAIGWTLYGGAENGAVLKLSSPAFAFSDDKLYKNSRTEMTIKLTEEGKAYVLAPISPKESDGLQITGYLFEIDSENDRVSAYYVTKNIRYPLGYKYCKIDVGVEYPAVLVYETLNNRKLAFYFNENPLDEEPYPKFELIPDRKSSGQIGVACLAGVTEFKIDGVVETEALSYEGLTYTNPIISGMTDPDMFYHEGKYYLYGTRASQNDGLYCYVSDDGVNFTDAGIVMRAEDVRGDKNFLTANILYHDGYFYMFYHADFKSGETTSQSYAYSTSPLGPFVAYDKNKTLYEREGMLGGQPFVDEDGKIYLVHVQINTGNETWLVEIECDKGKVTVKDETYTKLLVATEEWENAIATVLECGYLMKHNNLYYLIYAGGNYNSTYGVGFAVSEKITGPYEKYEGNPILYSNDQGYGNGAASVFPSLDGTEYFFVYLRHESSVSVRPLNTAMDRFKFVKRENGYDIISVYGGTVTPQPAPSNNGTTTAGELDRFQSNKD
ncbi:MAG: family 43 glycosylhydrolase [Clostridia bacterium]|nr:family 43 glycosylhydrolase [Clostridia bacterium]